MALLEITRFSKSFGGLRALSNVEMTVEKGEIRGLIGPNGAGKSTLINAVTGVYRPDKGATVMFAGENITGLPPHEVARRGLVRTFQTAEPFPTLTALENVMAGYHLHSHVNLFSAALGMPGGRRIEQQAREEALRLLDIAGLGDRKDYLARSLAFGQLRLLEIARALAIRPRMILLDEPIAGMNAAEVNAFLGLLRRLREAHGLTILLVEHNLSFVMRVCDTMTVLDHGEKIAEGPPTQVRHNPLVIEAYIGSAEVP